MTAFTRIPPTSEEMRICDEALEAVSRDADGSWRDVDLIAEIVGRLTEGTADDKQRRAQYLRNYLGRDTGNGMCLRIPGLRPRPPIPSGIDGDVVTVINDLRDDGMDTEQIDQMVQAHFPELDPVETALCWKAASEQLRWRVEAIEIQATLFEVWTERERAKGRRESDLIFGNFVRETGMLVYQA